MSEENKAIARRVIEELLNTGNPEIADEIFASGCVDPNPSNPELRGIENIKKSVDDWHAAFPDTHNTVDDSVAEGDKVAVRFTTRATHRGGFRSIRLTGNRVTVTSIGVFRLSYGKIAKSWNEFNADGLLRQLDANPVPVRGGS